MRKPYNLILAGIVTVCLGLVTFSALVHLYEKRMKIIDKLSAITGTRDVVSDYAISDADKYWAKEILNGGYILHFRHAERDKWIDVAMYDALESDLHNNGTDKSRYAENDYFASAVCLNERGKVQAKAIGEHIKHIGLPISKVVSSVSCRARQTAELAFGGYSSQHRLLVHTSPYNESEDDRIANLKKFYTSLTIEPNSNVIVSAHNSVVRKEMFANKLSKLGLEEGGFFVISVRDDKLFLEHEFHYFKNFMNVFYKR